MDDMKEVLRAELSANKAETNAKIAELDARLTLFSTMIESRFSSVDRKLDEILRIVGDHETRITNLEHRAG